MFVIVVRDNVRMKDRYFSTARTIALTCAPRQQNTVYELLFDLQKI